jgi:hypothetical protein
MSKHNKWMWPSVIGAVVVMGALLVAAQITKRPKLDAHGCGKELTGKTVFVIDQSEDLSEQTKNEIVARAMKVVAEKVTDGELVSVFSVTELSKKNLVPAFSYCKPTREGSRLTSNPKLLERIYRDKFAKPLEKSLRAPIAGSKESPVAQAIVDLSLSEYLTSPISSRLIVFSDLMEHTDKFSLYGCKATQEAVSRFRTARGATVARPAFKDMDVELNIVPRPNIPAPVAKCRDAFWVWFFGDNEGARASLTPNYLPG